MKKRLDVKLLYGAISLLTALSVTLLLPGKAPAASGGQIAAESRTAAQITFRPLVQWAGLTLTVSGPGAAHWTQEFGPGQTPSIQVVYQQGALPDGLYRYELVARPPLDPATQSAMEAYRTSGGTGGIDPVSAWEPLSGTFRISGGAIVPRRTTEADAVPLMSAAGDVVPLDQVILDDLIVDGSLCVGLDCVNGESFGFDTLRLKENNLRIHFDDTSNTASFPRNDWRIVVNDSSNGGLSRFSVEDSTNSRTPFTVEAGARDHALYVDDGGRLGLKTNAPVVEIHVKDGDTPTLRLEQDGSSGFTPQAWDVAGNETNFFVRDVTGGSLLPLRIRPGAKTSSIDVASSGRVGINTSSPDATLDVLATASTIGTGNVGVKVANSDGAVALQLDPGDDGTFWNFSAPSNDLFRISRSGTGATELELSSSGNLTIRGGLVTGTAGSCTSGSPCDGVFDPEFKLESIAEHAAYMWSNWHLPAVGPTPPDAPINLTRKTTGMLNELEKAHIYIAQLDERIRQLEAEIVRLTAARSAE